MNKEILKTNHFVKDGKLIIQYETDVDNAISCYEVLNEKNTVKIIDLSERELFDNLKEICCDFPGQKEWISLYLKVEDKINTLKSSNLPINVTDVADFMDVFLQPVSYLVEGNMLVDAIYRYSKKDIDWYIDSFLDYTDGELYNFFKFKIFLMKSMLGNMFSTKDILSALLNFNIVEYKEKGKIKTYIMSDISGLYKIGRSRDLDRRYMELKIGNPSIKIEFAFEGDYEKELHEKYGVKNRGGEWFALTEKDLEEIKRIYYVD